MDLLLVLLSLTHWNSAGTRKRVLLKMMWLMKDRMLSTLLPRKL